MKTYAVCPKCEKWVGMPSQSQLKSLTRLTHINCPHTNYGQENWGICNHIVWRRGEFTSQLRRVSDDQWKQYQGEALDSTFLALEAKKGMEGMAQVIEPVLAREFEQILGQNLGLELMVQEQPLELETLVSQLKQKAKALAWDLANVLERETGDELAQLFAGGRDENIHPL